MRNRLLLLIVTIIAGAILVACGGGGSSNGSTSSSGSGSTVSGVASSGSPISGASITVLSSNGQYYSPSITTTADGSFQFSLNLSSYPAPLLIQVSQTTGQSIGTYYSYVGGSDLSGLVVTPLSNAVVGLAANSNLDQIFTSGSIPAALNTSSIASALQVVAKATSNQLSAFGISDPTLLLKNSSYVANGSGQDAILDSVSISSANTGNGSVIVSSKLTGVSVQVDNGQSSVAITSIPFSPNSANLLTQINAGISSINNCIKNAVNTSSSTSSCIDPSFLNSGDTASTVISNLRSDIGSLSSVGSPSIRWCTVDTAGLTLDSSAASLSAKTGICNATFPVTATNGAGLANYFYKFTLNSAGNGVADIKAYGNQLKDSLEVNPQVYVKTRVDGFTTNIGTTSGYAFNIGTALQKTGGNPTVVSTSNLSAKVEVLDSSGNNLSTLYMECQQGSSCINTELTLCKSASSTCASGVDTVADSVLSVNSSLSSSIIQALKTGFVSARVTAYNKILSDNTKSTNFVKTIPIIGVPISQSIADNLIYPALTTASQSALAAWSGASSLTVNFSRGDQKINLYNIHFGAQPSAGVADRSVAIGSGALMATFTGIASQNGSTIIPLTAGCSSIATSTGAANWRAVYFEGSFNNVDVNLKTFGSCFSGAY
jgi:hypothetical protein